MLVMEDVTDRHQAEETVKKSIAERRRVEEILRERRAFPVIDPLRGDRRFGRRGRAVGGLECA
jgi:hypothetical protein